MFNAKICFKRKKILLLVGLMFTSISLMFATQVATEKIESTKNYDGLEMERFRFNLQSANEYLEFNAFRDPAKMSDKDRFRRSYYLRDWGAVQKAFSEMDEYRAEVVYSRILSELTQGRKPVLTIDDFMGILQACPIKPGNEWLKKLGLIANAVVMPEEEAQLAARLRQGTRFFGGKDLANRFRAGRILMYGSFNKAASEFLPSIADVGKIDELDVREEVMDFRNNTDKDNTDSVKRVLKRWDDYAKALLREAPDKNGKAFYELTQMVGHGVPYENIYGLIKDINVESKPLAGAFAMLVTKKIGDDQHNSNDVAMRTRNLELAAEMIKSLSGWTDIKKTPWSVIVNSLADTWIQEAIRTIKEKPEYEQNIGEGRWGHFIPPEDLLATIPKGIWLAALSVDRAKRITYYQPKVMMFSADTDRTIPLIIDLAKQDPEAAGVIAEEYLQRWAALHNPVIPDDVLKRYKLPAGSAIIVTPMMTDRNVRDFAAIMRMLRKNNIVPANGEEILKAFQMCYGASEIYRKEHIEKVFGPVADMDEGLFSVLMREISTGLATRWRKAAVQKSARMLTGRNNPLVVIRKAYADAVKMVDEWSGQNSDGWQPLTLTGTILTDWADFEFFQQMATSPTVERMQLYKEKSALAHAYFLRGAEAYARTVSSLSPASYSAKAYIDWFNSILGISSSGEINLSKGMNKPALEQIRTAIRSLPADSIDAHIELFAKTINEMREKKKDPLPSELKYRYASSALIITKDTPFGAALVKQKKYYNELLGEARLVTRIDGSDTICRETEFGIIVSLIHSVVLGDQINFAKYITPQPDFKNTGRLRKMKINAKAHNELEANILERLSPFFNVKAVVFSDKDVKPRDLDKAGWQETVLAYVQVSPKGVSVDRIPSLEMNLEFLDVTGPVTLPVISPETLIEIVGKPCLPRPYSNVSIRQALDTRKLYTDGILNLQVIAEGNGMIPALDQLLDITPMTEKLTILRSNSPDGTVIKQLYSWGEDVQIESSREWTIMLDSKPITDVSDKSYDFIYPVAKRTNVLVKNEVFDDADLISVDGSVVKLMKGSNTGVAIANRMPELTVKGKASFGIWVVIAIILLVGSGIVFVIVRQRAGVKKILNAKEIFKIPSAMDSFVLVKFLRNILHSPLVKLNDEMMKELKQEIVAVEELAFDPSVGDISEDEMRSIAQKWLKRI
jgi:hypothetical protein